MISLATQQNGGVVFVYDENGRLLFTKPGKLMGWTSTTVTTKIGNVAYVYDERGQLKFTRPTN